MYVFVCLYLSSSHPPRYCYRIWNARKMAIMSLADYKKELGKNTNGAYEEHHQYLGWLVMRVLEWVNQGRHREDLTKLSWPSKAQISMMEIVETVWIPP